MTRPTPDRLRTHLLDAAERTFHARGIQAVGMDELRAAADLPLKRIYQLYPSKDDLVVASLRRRHDRMMGEIRAYVGAVDDPEARVLAVFEWLHRWFRQPDFRGCPWMNAYGELGPTNPAVAAEVHHHQRAFRRLLTRIPIDAGYSAEVAHQIYLLVEGAVAVAAVQQIATPARQARRAARSLLAADRPTAATSDGPIGGRRG